MGRKVEMVRKELLACVERELLDGGELAGTGTGVHDERQ